MKRTGTVTVKTGMLELYRLLGQIPDPDRVDSYAKNLSDLTPEQIEQAFSHAGRYIRDFLPSVGELREWGESVPFWKNPVSYAAKRDQNLQRIRAAALCTCSHGLFDHGRGAAANCRKCSCTFFTEHI